MRSISPYSVRMRENTDLKNSEYGHFSRSGVLDGRLFGIPNPSNLKEILAVAIIR